MSTPLLDALRFIRGSVRPTSPLRTREVVIPIRGGRESTPASLVEADGPGPRPGWVVLHGLTRPGRHHPSLVRFVEALAAAGGRVLVPEITPWRELDFAPGFAQRVIGATVRRLADDPGSEPGGVTLLGFSFGVPQAVHTASDPELQGFLRGVVGWGGYSDLGRTFRFQFLGQHQWEERELYLRPDPYGRWVVGANCLRLELGLGDTVPVADALRSLATEAGNRQVAAWDQSFRSLQRYQRRMLPPRLRSLYDLFVPPEGQEPERAAVDELLARMVPMTREAIPLLDPIRFVERIPLPVRLLHPREDHLIPFTETLALARRLEGRSPDVTAEILGLLGHSGRGSGEGVSGWPREGLVFLRALAGVFEVGGSVRSRSGPRA